MYPRQQKVKKKKKKEEKKPEPVLDIRKIPAPHKIKASLDDYIVGQEYAKKLITEEVKKYKDSFDKNKTQYKILSEETQADGSVIIEVKKQSFISFIEISITILLT